MDDRQAVEQVATAARALPAKVVSPYGYLICQPGTSMAKGGGCLMITLHRLGHTDEPFH